MDTKKRCDWVNLTNPEYCKYHDEEWGVPVHDDTKQFEFIILEGAQAGLSWETILKRRAGYKRCFANFDPRKVAAFTNQQVENILTDVGIIRNKLKVRGAVQNAQAFLKVQLEFGSFSNYIWQFVNNTPIIHQWESLSEIPAVSHEATLLSKDLKKRGFTFVGPTIMYAHMQATGLVMDHTKDCFRYKELTAQK